MAENKLNFSDIIELAKAGYTPEQVKELIQLSKDTEQTEQTKHNEQNEHPEQNEQTEQTKQNDELNKLKEHVKKLQEQNRRQDFSNKNEKTAEEILADIVSEYI